MTWVLSGVEECSHSTAGGRPRPALGDEQQRAHLAVDAVLERHLLQGVAGPELPGHPADAGRSGPRRQVAERAHDRLVHLRPAGGPGRGVLRGEERPGRRGGVGHRHARVPRRLLRPVRGPGRGTGLRCGQRAVAADDQLALHAIGDGLGQSRVAAGRVVGAVGRQQVRPAAGLDHPVQVVHRHGGVAHDLDRAVVVAAHVGVEPVERAPAPACRASSIGVLLAKTRAASVARRTRSTSARRLAAYRSSGTWYAPPRRSRLRSWSPQLTCTTSGAGPASQASRCRSRAVLSPPPGSGSTASAAPAPATPAPRSAPTRGAYPRRIELPSSRTRGRPGPPALIPVPPAATRRRRRRAPPPAAGSPPGRRACGTRGRSTPARTRPYRR